MPSNSTRILRFHKRVQSRGGHLPVALYSHVSSDGLCACSRLPVERCLVCEKTYVSNFALESWNVLDIRTVVRACLKTCSDCGWTAIERQCL